MHDIPPCGTENEVIAGRISQNPLDGGPSNSRSLYMSRDHASKGYQVVSGTDAVSVNFYGFTAAEETVVAAIAAPAAAGMEHTSYSSGHAGMAGVTVPAGCYLPIRGSSLTLTSGKLIAWIE